MITIRNFPIVLCLVLTLFAGQAVCLPFEQTGKIELNKIFTLQSGETVETKDGKLRVKLKSVGRTISESGETEYIELTVWVGKSERIITLDERGGASKIVGNYFIKLINAESFGKTHCQLKILRKSKS